MKCQVVFLFVVVFVALVSADEKRRIFEECQADPATYVEESLLQNLGKGKVDREAIGPHCICMNVKFGIQKPNGDIEIEILRKAMKTAPEYDVTKVDAIIEECGTRKSATALEAAVDLSECLSKHKKGRHHE